MSKDEWGQFFSIGMMLTLGFLWLGAVVGFAWRLFMLVSGWRP